MSRKKPETTSQDLGEWIAEMTWEETDLQAGPTQLVIRPKDLEHVPAGGLSSTVVRKVNFRTAAAERREAADVTTSYVAWIKSEYGDAERLIVLALNEGVTDAYLALLAMDYVGRVDAGKAKPVDRIAEDLGRSVGTIKGHLWQARNRGLLEGGSAGRKGGTISEEARQLAVDWAAAHASK